jgi:nucleoside-diphosphate-sugar epimerase
MFIRAFVDNKRIAMKILITGAKGNLGSALKSSGKRDNDIIIPIGRENWKELDLINVNSVDAVIHCAYDLKNKFSVAPEKIIESNLLSTARILDFCKEKKVKKFIFISTCAVYGRNSDTSEDSACLPETSNGFIKLLNEKMIFENLANSAVEFKILRVFNLYGRDDNFSVVKYLLDAVDKKSSFYYNNEGVSRRDFIHVDDVVSIIYHLIHNKEKIEYNVLNIGTGRSISIEELVNYISKRVKINIIKQKNNEIEYSRAKIDRLNSFCEINFKDVFDYLESELKKRSL